MVHYLSYYKFTFIFISTRGYFTASFGPFGYALTIGSLFGSLSLLGCWCRLDYGCHNFLFVIASLGSYKVISMQMNLFKTLYPDPKSTMVHLLMAAWVHLLDGWLDCLWLTCFCGMSNCSLFCTL